MAREHTLVLVLFGVVLTAFALLLFAVYAAQITAQAASSEPLIDVAVGLLTVMYVVVGLWLAATGSAHVFGDTALRPLLTLLWIVLLVTAALTFIVAVSGSEIGVAVFLLLLALLLINTGACFVVAWFARTINVVNEPAPIKYDHLVFYLVFALLAVLPIAFVPSTSAAAVIVFLVATRIWSLYATTMVVVLRVSAVTPRLFTALRIDFWVTPFVQLVTVLLFVLAGALNEANIVQRAVWLLGVGAAFLSTLMALLLHRDLRQTARTAHSKLI